MEQLIQIVGGIRIKEKQVFVGDPGLEKSNWLTIKIAPGLYQCSVFLASTDGTADGSTTVQMSLLNMDKKPKNKPKIAKIGVISVDSGVAGFMLSESVDGKTLAKRINGINKTVLDDEMGFVSKSGMGDGQYPVITFTDSEDQIVGLTIPFI